MSEALLIGVIGLLITIGSMLATIAFKSGNTAARLEALEKWRIDMRRDMHEISDKMTTMIKEVHGVRTLIEERTERRKFLRDDQ